jgi:hypothetical protein
VILVLVEGVVHHQVSSFVIVFAILLISAVHQIQRTNQIDCKTFIILVGVISFVSLFIVVIISVIDLYISVNHLKLQNHQYFACQYKVFKTGIYQSIFDNEFVKISH